MFPFPSFGEHIWVRRLRIPAKNCCTNLLFVFWLCWLLVSRERNTPRLNWTNFNIFLFVVGIAAGIPFIGLFISLVGALCISVLGLVCPALMEICVLYKDKLTALTVAKNIFFILVGLVGLAVGTYTSCKDIYLELTKEPPTETP